MVKTYLRFDLTTTLGQITSNSANIVISKSKKELYTSCNDYILSFDLKTGLPILKLTDQRIKITCLSISQNYLSVGYENGSISLIDISLPKEKISFTNKKYFIHKSSITSLNFNSDQSYLLSGSNDTNLIITDLIGDITLFKFNGHKDNIIKCEFYSLNEDYIFSISKDNSFKIWNIKNQICLFNYVDMVHKNTNFLSYDNFIIFGSFDEKMKIFEINNDELNKSETNTGNKKIFIQKGQLIRQSKSKILSFDKSDDDSIFSILSNDNSIEFFKILSKKEIINRLILSLITKDKNEKKEKLLKKEKFTEFINKAKELYKKKEYNYNAKFHSIFKFEENQNNIRKNVKIYSLFIINNQTFGIGKNRNLIEIYNFTSDMLNETIYTRDKENYLINELNSNSDNFSLKKNYSINSFGHREGVKYIKYTFDSKKFITMSNDSVKLWNIDSFNPIKTIQIKNGTSCSFFNKDTYIAISTREGNLFILDLNSFQVLYSEEKIHDESINNIITYNLSKNKTRLISCSNDKKIKYWNINYSLEKNNEISFELYNEMILLDSISYCLLSPNKKFLIYSLMDNSIKILFEDSQKIFLNLYGHKMPITCFDISSDNNLLISGSIDKNIKIWGMDFGDCHKTFKENSDIITCIKFFNLTHFFLAASKDKSIKFYDADIFQLIFEFSNNFFYDTIYWFDINKEGTQFITVSADFSIKIFDITNEQIIPQFNQDEKIDRLINEEAEKDFEKKDFMINPLNKEIDSIIPIKKRMDNIGFAEEIMDAINLCDKYKEEVYQYEIAMEEYNKALDIINSKDKNKIENLKFYNLEIPEKPKPSLLFLGMNIFDYMLYKIKKIRMSELESSLNNIPYTYFQRLIFYFEYFIRNNIEIELIGRCVIFFSFLYQNQISNDKTIINYMISIKEHLKGRLQFNLDLVNFNVKSIDMILRTKDLREKADEDYKKNKNGNLDIFQ